MLLLLLCHAVGTLNSFEGRNIYSDSDDDDGDDGVSSYLPLVQLTDLCACTSPVHMVCMPGRCRSFYVLVAFAVIAVAWRLHRKWNSARRFCEQRLEGALEDPFP